MFSQLPDSKSKSNHPIENLKRKREEQELNDRAIAEALETDVDAFDEKPANHPPSRKRTKPTQNQLSNEEPNKNLRETRITRVPEWHAKVPAPANMSDQNTVPAELRGITLGYLNNDIVGETKEHSFAPAGPKKFVFFNQTDLPVTAFLNHVVHGDLVEAKAMLDKNPSLVLYKGQVTDYSGRTIEGTGYEIALGAEDVSRKEHPKEGMADMIRKYFIKALNHDEKSANEEIEKQFNEQFPTEEFPEYYEPNEEKQAEIIKRKIAADPDIQELETLAKAILHADEKEIKATPTDKQDQYGYDEYELKVTGECAKALQAFRDYLNPQAVIKKGKHFNTQLLVKALEKYAGEQHDLFGGLWNNPKNLLFWRQVIGYIERYLPANLAQAFCQGLWNVTDGGQSLKRNLKLDDKSFFFPPDLSSSSGLGFDHSVYSYLGGCAGSGEQSGVTHGGGRARGAFLQTYVEQKQQSFVCLCGMLKNGQRRMLHA